jgi:hypothetical protein
MIRERFINQKISIYESKLSSITRSSKKMEINFMRDMYDAMQDHIAFSIKNDIRWNGDAQFDFDEIVPCEEVLESFTGFEEYTDEDIRFSYDVIRNEYLEWKQSELEDELENKKP